MNTTIKPATTAIIAAVEEILAGGQPATSPVADDPSFVAPIPERADHGSGSGSGQC
jgi:hypothetical protein